MSTASLNENASQTNDTTQKAKEFISILADPTVQQMLKQIFDGSIDSKIQPLKDQVKKIEEKDTKSDETIKGLQADVDSLQQEKRSANVIITGLTEKTPTPDDIKRLLNEKIGTTLTTYEITNITSLHSPNKEVTITDPRPPRIRVQFANPEIKQQVTKKKKVLRGEKTLWIIDDLIPNRSKLAYEARKATKDGRLAQTWTHNAIVFGKTTPTGKPFKINHNEDIPIKR